MAAVTRVKSHPCTPVGYEYVTEGAVLTEAVFAGDLLIQGASGWSKLLGNSVANLTARRGMAMQDGYAGQRDASIAIHGEADGFSGMTPGAPLYPSASVAGGIDTVANVFYTAATTPVVNVPEQPRMWAASASRVYFSF